jgi:hypothetical protein
MACGRKVSSARASLREANSWKFYLFEYFVWFLSSLLLHILKDSLK